MAERRRPLRQWLGAAALGFCLLATAAVTLMPAGNRLPRRAARALLSRVLPASLLEKARPVSYAGEHPVRRTGEVVQPKRLDAWTIIGPGGGGTLPFTIRRSAR